MELWNAFLEDYNDNIQYWSLQKILRLFWYYCQDGRRAVDLEYYKEN